MGLIVIVIGGVGDKSRVAVVSRPVSRVTPPIARNHDGFVVAIIANRRKCHLRDLPPVRHSHVVGLVGQVVSGYGRLVLEDVGHLDPEIHEVVRRDVDRTAGAWIVDDTGIAIVIGNLALASGIPRLVVRNDTDEGAGRLGERHVLLQVPKLSGIEIAQQRGLQSLPLYHQANKRQSVRREVVESGRGSVGVIPDAVSFVERVAPFRLGDIDAAHVLPRRRARNNYE